jgi:3-oxoacyl-[acyl-carrier protein] reductase
MKLKGKKAIVTGSSFGIGQHIALRLAAEGASVIVNARGSGPTGKGAIDAVVEEIRSKGGTAVGVAGAVDDPAFAKELIEQCVKHFGGIDILVNNAAILSQESLGPVDKCPVDMWEKILKVNLSGPFLTCREALPYMVKQRSGRIINAGSYAGLGWMGGSAYIAAKSGLFGFTRAIASDYGPYGITANVYNPEAMTPMGDSAGGYFELLKYCEARGYRTPEETKYLIDIADGDGVAPWVAYLASDDSDYLNGQVFAVEGRRVAMVAMPEEERVLFHDYKANGAWSLDKLSLLAPLAFPVKNRWPRREGEDLVRWEKGVAA